MTDTLPVPIAADVARCNADPSELRRTTSRDAVLPIRLGLGAEPLEVTVSGAFELIWDIASAVASRDDRFDPLLRTIERMACRFAREDLASRRALEAAS